MENYLLRIVTSKNLDWHVSIIAKEWIQEQISEFSGFKAEIIKVTWKEEHDITEIVKQMRPIEPAGDLPK